MSSENSLIVIDQKFVDWYAAKRHTLPSCAIGRLRLINLMQPKVMQELWFAYKGTKPFPKSEEEPCKNHTQCDKFDKCLHKNEHLMYHYVSVCMQ